MVMRGYVWLDLEMRAVKSEKMTHILLVALLRDFCKECVIILLTPPQHLMGCQLPPDPPKKRM